MSFLRKIKYNSYWWLVAIIFLAFYQVAAMLHPMKWDIVDQFFPCRYLLSESLKNGIVPLWCPYINLGYPFYADPQAGIHYPISWLIAVTTGYSMYAIHVEFLLHVVLSAWAVYKLLYYHYFHRATAFVGAVIFSLSGIIVGNAQHLTWLISICWLLWSVYFMLKLNKERQWIDAVKLALVLAFSLLGGYPAFGIIAVYCFIGYFIWLFFQLTNKERVKLLQLYFFCGLLFLFFIANYLLSLAEVMPFMNRGAGLTAAQVNFNAFTLQSFISLITPYATVADTGYFNTDISMSNLYLGMLLLPVMCYELISGKLSSRLFFLIAVLLLLTAMGEATPFRKWLYYSLPGMKLFKMASIFRVFAAFFLLLIFSSGIHHIFQKKRLSLFRNIMVCYVLVLALLSLAVQLLPIFPNAIRHHFEIQMYVHFFGLTVLLVAFFWEKAKLQLSVIIVVVIISDMVTAVWFNQPFTVTDATVSCRSLQQKIDLFPKGFYTLPTQKIADVSSIGNESIAPLWQNTSIYRKEVAFDGFNNFYTENYKKITPNDIQHPLFYALDSTSDVRLTLLTPNQIAGAVTTAHIDTVKITQNNFRGWTVIVDGKKIDIDNQNKLPEIVVLAGRHRINFVFENKRAYYMLIINVLSILFTIILLIYISYKKRFLSTFMTKL